MREARLETRTARAALKPSGKPYWRAIDEGLHLGYRRNKSGGKWVLRRHAGGKKVYEVETIGTADDTIDPDGATILSFSQAQALARKRFVERKRIAAGLPAEAGPYTIKVAIDEYIAWLEQNRKSSRDARWRADALILPELGNIECAKLTTKTIRDWRDKIARTPPRLRTRKVKPQQYRHGDDPEQTARRRRPTANRIPRWACAPTGELFGCRCRGDCRDGCHRCRH